MFVVAWKKEKCLNGFAWIARRKCHLEELSVNRIILELV